MGPPPQVNNPYGVTTPAPPDGSVTGMKAGGVGAALALTAALAAGCSSGGGSTASSTSPSPAASASPSGTGAVCPDVAALRASVAEVGHLSANGDALGKLKTDVARVRANLAMLRADVSSEWHIQIDALSSSLATLQKTLSTLGSQPSATAAAKAVSDDLATVTGNAAALLTAASTRCPSASASPTE